MHLRIEALETRELLSASGLPVAQAALEVKPLVTSNTPYGYTPAQIRHAYGFDQVRFGNGSIIGDGRGQTIALIAAYDDPTILSDLHTFDRTFGLPDPPSFTKINQAGGTSRFPAASQTWALEISLDVEWAHAIAPAANIVLVEANSGWLGDLLTAVDYARKMPNVSVVSMSWGSGEFWSETYYDSYFKTPAGHQGVTFVAASGDSGVPASWPAVSPNVLSVGGTNLYLGAGGAYGSESGWAHSGGSISAYETQALGQHSLIPWVWKRTAPDVSYDANPNTGFAVYDSMGYGSYTGWLELGGTSAGAPQWAGLIAIANQGRSLAGKGTLDGASGTLPAIYSMPASAFHDVFTGNNGYNAIRGYDCVTGRGTPIANAVIQGLVYAGGSMGSGSTFTLAAATGTTASPHVAGLMPVGDPIPAGVGSERVMVTSGATVDAVASAGPAPVTHRTVDMQRPRLAQVEAFPGRAEALPRNSPTRPTMPVYHEATASDLEHGGVPLAQNILSFSGRSRYDAAPVSHEMLPDDDAAWLAFGPTPAASVVTNPAHQSPSALDRWAAASLVALGLNASVDRSAEERKRRKRT